MSSDGVIFRGSPQRCESWFNAPFRKSYAKEGDAARAKPFPPASMTPTLKL